MGESAWLFPTSPIALYLRTTAYVMSSNCPMIPSLECWRRSIEVVCAAMLVPPCSALLCDRAERNASREGGYFCYRQRLVCGYHMCGKPSQARPWLSCKKTLDLSAILQVFENGNAITAPFRDHDQLFLSFSCTELRIR